MDAAEGDHIRTTKDECIKDMTTHKIKDRRKREKSTEYDKYELESKFNEEYLYDKMDGKEDKCYDGLN